MPSSRDAIVHGLRGTRSAYKIYTGKPKSILSDLLAGKIIVPKSDGDLSAFAFALHGLPNDFAKIDQVRPVVLECLRRDKEEKRRSETYRAACRVDEIIHYQQNRS